MRKFLVLILITIFSSQLISQNCIPGVASSDVVTRAVASVNYNSYNFTGALINNSNDDGRLLFLTSSYPFVSGCDNGLFVNIGSTISQISFKWINNTITYGAKLLEVNGEFALLELNNKPTFEIYSFLGFITSGSNPTFCISSYPLSNGKNLVKLDVGGHGPAFVETNCSNSSSDSYNTNNNGSDILVKSWQPNVELAVNEYTKGAVLLDSENKIMGIYVTHVNPLACDKVDYEQAYFKSLTTFQTLNHATNLNGITFEPCKNIEVVDFPVNSPEIYTATIRVIGRSSINNQSVIFKGGEEVLLENGFDSGNDFIAEIEPCVAKVEVLASKNNDENYISNSNHNFTSNKSLNIVAYPSVLIENKITIENEGVGYFNFEIIDFNGSVIKRGNNNMQAKFDIDLPNLSSGVYFLKVSNKDFMKTIKLIKE